MEQAYTRDRIQLILHGMKLVPVNSIQWEDSTCVDINGVSDNDGIDVL